MLQLEEPGEVTVITNLDQTVSVTGHLFDVLAHLRHNIRADQMLVGLICGVTYAMLARDMTDFHVQMVDEASANRVMVRVTFSDVPGMGWGVTILENPKPRTLQ